MRNRTTVAVVSVLSLLLAPSVASALSTLTVSDGVSSITIDDNSADDANAELGVVGYIGTLGGDWLVSTSVGATKPAVGSPTAPMLNLHSSNTTTGDGGTLTIRFSDDGFGPLPSAGQFMGLVVGVAAGPATFSTWGDAGNAKFVDDGATAQMAFGPAGPGLIWAPMFASTGPLSSPYSLTLEAVLTHSPDGAHESSVDMVLLAQPAVPEPLTVLGVCGGLAGLGAYIRKRRAAA